MKQLKDLPSLNSYFNKTVNASSVSQKDLENAFDVSRNLNIEGLWVKVYREIKLFNQSSKYEITFILDDNLKNRALLRNLRETI